MNQATVLLKRRNVTIPSGSSGIISCALPCRAASWFAQSVNRAIRSTTTFGVTGPDSWADGLGGFGGEAAGEPLVFAVRRQDVRGEVEHRAQRPDEQGRHDGGVDDRGVVLVGRSAAAWLAKEAVDLGVGGLPGRHREAV